MLELPNIGSLPLFLHLFLFLLANHHQIFLFLIDELCSLFVLPSLAIQKLHERHWISNGLGIVNENEFFLAVVQHLMSSFPGGVQNEEVRWPALPRSWMVWVLRPVDLYLLVSFFQLLSPLGCSLLSVTFSRIIFFNHWRTEIPLLRGLPLLFLFCLVLSWLSLLFNRRTDDFLWGSSI